MAAGDTIFGDHEKLIKQIPSLMSATEKAMKAKNVHPLILSARFHGYCEYLHPFRDGNGRTGRLLSNFILLQQNHPLLIIKIEDKDAYLESLRQIRKEGTDEHLIRFFFKTAMQRMESELNQKLENSRPHSSFY
jgi:Fic family protein